ncbi:hypothetical protein QYF36_009666 [Acer negundo]|nr:hypothetical protein QYF36_009666 [Acer negundo]
MEMDRVLGTTLIDMYAKCGYIETARSVFNNLSNMDVFAFTSLVSGLANHSHSGSAIDLFLNGFGGSRVESMSEMYGIEPGMQHYGCLVDFLGRAGMLKEAVHGDFELGKETVERFVERSLDRGGVHVLRLNLMCFWRRRSHC